MALEAIVSMDNFAGINSTTRWVVLYGGQQDGDDFYFWGAMQTEQEAIWQAYQREKLGWCTRIVPPTPVVYEPLPTYGECERRVHEGQATALDWFIYDNEPAGPAEDKFRRQLAAVIRQAGGKLPQPLRLPQTPIGFV